MKVKMKKLQNLTDLLIGKWLLLDARAELLRPSLTDHVLVKNFSESDRARGFDLNRLSLAEICLTQASALLKSTNDTDVSLCNIIDCLRTEDLIYTTLKMEFCRTEHMNFLNSGELDEEVLATIEKKHVAGEVLRKGRQFDAVASEIVSRYDLLVTDGLGNKIIRIRNQVTAHFGTHCVDQKRVTKSTADLGLIVSDIFEIVEELGDLCKKCALVICNTGWDFDDSRQSHREDARAYWGLEIKEDCEVLI